MHSPSRLRSSRGLEELKRVHSPSDRDIPAETRNHGSCEDGGEDCERSRQSMILECMKLERPTSPCRCTSPPAVAWPRC